MSPKSDITIDMYDHSGGKTGVLSVSASAFDTALNRHALSDVLVALQKNKRVSTAHAKSRADVRGGGRKPWRQKGTGRARHGSIRSPIWRGGGAAHGPTSARTFQVKINAKIRTHALAMALSQKRRDGEIRIVETVPPVSKTKDLVGFLGALFPERTSSVCIVVSEHSNELIRASRNIPRVLIREARELNPLDVMSVKEIIMTAGAAEVLEKRLS